MVCVIAPQADLAAVLLGVLGLVLAAVAFGYRRIAGLPWRESRSQATGLATIEAENDLTLDAFAAKLLDVAPGSVHSVGALVEATAAKADPAHEGPSFQEALTALVATGAAFEMLIRVRSGMLVSARGAAAGRRAIVRFRQASPEEMALSEAVAARRAAEARADLMAAAAEGHDAVAFCLDPGGGTQWRSAAFDTLPQSGQAALLTEARAYVGSPDDPAQADVDFRVVIELPGGKALHLALAPKALPEGRRLWLARDISREVDAESAFRRFVHTMSDTFAHLKMSLMIFDRDCRLTLFNPATVDVIRLEATWLAQRPTLKALLDRMRDGRVTPEQANYIEWRDRVLAAVAPASVNGPAADDDETRLEDLWHLANGRTLHVLARPHPSGGLAVVIDDVSDTMALRRQSISERAVHVATIDMLEEAVILFAADGTAHMSNPSFRALWRFGEDKVAGRHVSAIVQACRSHTPDATFWDELNDYVTGQRRRSGASAKLTLRDGRVMMARLSSVPDGSVLAVFADITDSERIAATLIERNEVLEQTQEMRAALIDQISHQIRTPLNSISGFGQLLREQHFGVLNEQQAEYIDGIATASRELLGAINGMTEIIDLDDNITTSPASGAGILDEVVTIVNQRNGREVVRAADTDPLAPPASPPATIAAAQRGHLRQIMFNLIIDALSGPVAPDEGPLDMADVAIGVEGDALHIVCSRREDAPRAGPTLAFAMASRLARILGGAVTVEIADGVRTLHCQTPVAAVSGGNHAPPAPNVAAAATERTGS